MYSSVYLHSTTRRLCSTVVSVHSKMTTCWAKSHKTSFVLHALHHPIFLIQAYVFTSHDTHLQRQNLKPPSMAGRSSYVTGCERHTCSIPLTSGDIVAGDVGERSVTPRCSVISCLSYVVDAPPEHRPAMLTFLPS